MYMVYIHVYTCIYVYSSIIKKSKHFASSMTMDI